MRSAAAIAPGASLLAEQLRLGQWSEICAIFERKLARQEQEDPANVLAYAIALLRLGRTDSGLNRLSAETVSLPWARLALRRHAIAWLVQEKQFDAAIAILSHLLSVDPASMDELKLRASLLGRCRRYDEAIADARRLISIDPADLAGHQAYIQLLLQHGGTVPAGKHAQGLGLRAAEHPRLAIVAMLALVRSGQLPQAVELAAEAADFWPDDADVIQTVVRTLDDGGQMKRAVEIGEHCLGLGARSSKLRHFLGKAWLSLPGPGALDRAIEHLEAALRFGTAEAGIPALLGEALMRKGCHLEAIDPLGTATRLQPDNAQARSLLARALKSSGRYEEAAREFRTLLQLQPGSHRWHRYAAGALSQAGHRAEAAELFDAFVARRAAGLPEDFEAGLARLWDETGSVQIPAARLEWAWRLRDRQELDREEWERRARWGCLADHYILDWLECRDGQVHEAMGRLADLSEIERKFATVDARRGMILASAHVGPMYAGPLALELLDVRSQWLASTPSVARTAYARSLISTSDQSGSEVARKVLGSLQQGNAVVIAVDGAISMAAPRIAFEGQEITYSSFAARMAHRLNIPSMFVAPRWEDGQIGFVVEPLPDPEAGETADHHAARWKQAYLDELRTYIGGRPENLRLSGGLWRHIRAPGPDNDIGPPA